MDILGALGLIVVILLALNHMAGGSPANVLRPTGGLVTRVASGVIKLVTGLLGSVFKIGAKSIGSAKLPGIDRKDERQGPGPPPPRWE